MARLAGDELVLLLEDLVDSSDAAEVAESILGAARDRGPKEFGSRADGWLSRPPGGLAKAGDGTVAEHATHAIRRILAR